MKRTSLSLYGFRATHTQLIWLLAGLVCTIVLLIGITTKPANAATMNVPADYATIQAALAAASDGDTINVASGTYTGTLVVDKSVAIVGASGAILDGEGNAGPGITISAANVTIDGLEVRNYQGMTGKGAGILLANGANNITVQNTTLRDNSWAGIMAWTDGSAMLSNLSFINNTIIMGDWSPNNNVYGIECTNCTETFISKNSMTGGYVGILITAQGTSSQSIASANIAISENSVSDVSFSAMQVVSFDPTNSGGTPSISNISVSQNNFTANTTTSTMMLYTMGDATLSNLFISANTMSDTSSSIANSAQSPNLVQSVVANMGCTANGGCDNIVLAAQQTDANMIDIRNTDGISMTGNAITSNGRSGAVLFIANSTGVEMSNNTFTINNALGQAVYTNGCENVQFQNNNVTVNNPQGNTTSWRNHAIDIYYTQGAVVDGNTITIQGTMGSGSTFYHAINLEGNSGGTFTISYNDLIGNNVGSESTGLRIRAPQSASSTIQVENNVIGGFVYGVWVDEMPVGITININKNDLSGNKVGLKTSPDGAVVNAGYNFWGDEEDPYDSGKADGNATVYPILREGLEDNDPNTPGYQIGEPGNDDIITEYPTPPSDITPKVFMPILQNYKPEPVVNIIKADLVGQIVLSPNKTSFEAGEAVQVTLIITNLGQVDATSPFWVDMYFNPNPVPTSAGISWYDTCGLKPCYGLVWSVPTLQPGQGVRLTSDSGNYNTEYSSWYGWLASGTTDIYAYLDSWGGSRDKPGGGVTEDNEANNLVHLGGLRVTGETPFVPTTSIQSLPRPSHPRPDGK